MATLSISQMNTITNPSASDLIEVAQPDSGSASGYITGKESLSQIANLVATGTQFAGLQTTDQSLVGSINEVFQSVSDGKELIADAITDKGVPTSANDTFQDMADNIASISGGGVKVTPLSVYVNTGDQTYTKTVTDGIYLMGYLTANNQTGSITISGTYTQLYNKYSQQIVKVEGTATITFTLTADTSYPNAHVFAYIYQIEGATTFTDYYGHQTYDSGEVYDFSNLGSGKYIVIASGTSIYQSTSYAYVTYPWHPTSGRITELGDISSYYNEYGYRALTIVVREAPSASHLSSSIYAYGQYGGRGTIQIIEVS